MVRSSRTIEARTAEEQHRLQPLQPYVLRCQHAVEAAAQSVWPNARVELFGSWACGLQTSWSDVDLVVCGVPSELPPPKALEMPPAGLTSKCTQR